MIFMKIQVCDEIGNSLNLQSRLQSGCINIAETSVVNAGPESVILLTNVEEARSSR